jgi:sporulation protein YlmC with PRC-barrel domain
MNKTSSELRKMAVVGAGGRVFGTVDEVEIATDTLRIAALTVRINSEAVEALGIKKPFWSHATLVVHAADVQGITDVVVLRYTIEQFAERLGAAVAQT